MKFSDLKTKPKILLGICSPLVLLLILGGVSVYSINTIVETNKRVNHTHVVLGDAAAIVGSAVDMETGMRGYLLAGKEGFLDPYRGGEKATYEGIAALQKTVDDNPKQVVRLKEVEKVLREWQEQVSEPAIALRRKIGTAKNMDDMADVIGEARGKKYFDRFRAIMADFRAEETGLMEQRQANNEETVSNTYFIIGVCIAMALFIGFLLAWLIGNGIANPIKLMTEVMKQLAGGDTSADIPGTDRSDEIGEMADAVQVFKDNAIEKVRLDAEQAEEQAAKEEEVKRVMDLCSTFDKDAATALECVASAATEMQSNAASMSATAEETNQQAAAVASASEQATTNVQTVAAATDEMSASITEIGRQVQQSAAIATRAVDEAEKTNGTVQGLAEAAEKIGAVVDLITGIAEQTNLLALNATIEAARAGDAGKGFAVVASEVKSLAAQTAKATEQIGSQIADIQSVAGEAVDAIGGIGKTITEVNDIAATIAAAVEEQSAATGEISRNVQEAAAGTQEVSSNITGVSEGAEETGKAANQVLEAAGQLSRQSEGLREAVDKFLADIRAA